MSHLHCPCCNCVHPVQPVADKAELSSAIITDTLAALPVPPETVSHVQGPILEVHQVTLDGQ
jgi:hypothetical protein